jgi:hypothetical protein
MKKTALIIWLSLTITLGLFYSLNLVDMVEVSADNENNVLTIVRPENITYSMTSVDLEVKLKGNHLIIRYSLDDGELESLSEGKTTLKDLSEGSHNLVVYAWDLQGNSVSSSVVFSVDTTPPEITINSPQETTYSTSEIHLDFTVSEPVNWIAYSLDDKENVSITESTVLSGLSDGEHRLKMYAEDIVGNTGVSDTVNFKVDTTPPKITITSPQQNTFYSTTRVDLTFIVNEEADWTGYSLDGAENVTSGNTTLTNLSEGSHTVIVYAKDSAGNMDESDVVTFTVDTTLPTITINLPQETTYSTSEIDFKFVVSEPVSWMAYSLDGEDNVTLNGDTVLTDLKDGEHTIKIFARDTVGNTGVSDTVNFKVDTTPPKITITSPERTTYTTTNVFLDFTINEKATWIGYSLDYENNVTITGSPDLYNLTEGPHSIVVFATDNAGNTGASTAVEFIISIPPVDNTPPTIKINSPENSTYTMSTINLNFNIDEQASWIAYNLDGIENITLSGNSTLSGLSEGIHSMVVYATDTAGNTGTSDPVQFVISTTSVDSTPPKVVINSPENTTYNTNEISLTFMVNEEPTQKFYSLDGNTNITVVQSTAISNLTTGKHTLTMYAQDSTGNIGASQQVTFTITNNNGDGQLWTVGVIVIIPALIGLMFSIYIAHDLIENRRKQTKKNMPN